MKNNLTAKIEGSTLSITDVNRKESEMPTHTPTTQPSLLAPTIIQVNVYINNTSPIYNEIYNQVLSTLSVYPSPPNTMNIQNTPTPTIFIVPTVTNTPTPTPLPLLSSFDAKYFNNMTLTGTPALIRQDNKINFEWGSGSPADPINKDSFSVMWEGILNTEEGTYQITTKHDDTMRIYINNSLVYTHWSSQTPLWRNKFLNLNKGVFPIKIEYIESTSDATAIFDIKKQ